MSRSSSRLLSAVLYAAPLAGLAFLSPAARASNQGIAGPESFSLSPSASQSADVDATSPGQQADEATSGSVPLYLDAAPEEKPNIHGFFDSPFKTSYTTPRGLVVEDHGVVWQPIVGLVFPLAFDLGPITKPAVVAGIWNSVAGAQADPSVGGWEEMDVFVDIGGNIGKVKADLTYGDWNFPASTLAKPKAEKNLDLKLVYDDSDMWGKESSFAINPYVDIFWGIAGSSTVVLGRPGNTGYVEIGVVPTYTYKGVTNWPITLTMPVYFSVGPASYWGDPASGGARAGNFGVFVAGLNGSVPLNFIPAKYGFWHAEAGVTYFYLKNDNLLHAGELVSGNTNRNFVQGSVGVGVNF